MIASVRRAQHDLASDHKMVLVTVSVVATATCGPLLQDRRDRVDASRAGRRDGDEPSATATTDKRDRTRSCRDILQTGGPHVAVATNRHSDQHHLVFGGQIMLSAGVTEAIIGGVQVLFGVSLKLSNCASRKFRLTACRRSNARSCRVGGKVRRKAGHRNRLRHAGIRRDEQVLKDRIRHTVANAYRQVLTRIGCPAWLCTACPSGASTRANGNVLVHSGVAAEHRLGLKSHLTPSSVANYAAETAGELGARTPSWKSKASPLAREANRSGGRNRRLRRTGVSIPTFQRMRCGGTSECPAV